MPAEYPKNPQDYEEEEEEEEDEEEDEEDDERPEEWDALTALDEIDALEDGPSTWFVGGFSACRTLSQAVAKTRYTQDRVLVFPGTYTEAALALAPNEADRSAVGSERDVVVLDEARLKGLTIESVPFARATDPFATASASPVNGGPSPVGKADAASQQALRALLLLKPPPVGRRVGPWFTYYHAAAGAAEAAGASATATATATTTMGSSIFGSVVTPTVMDPASCPIISSRLILRTADAVAAKGGAVAHPLKVYRQEADEDEADEDGGEDEGSGEDNGDERGSDGDDNGGTKEPKPAIIIRGLCFPAGATLEPLTSSLMEHCVLGVPSLLSTSAITGEVIPRHRTTLLIHPLSEARVSRCVVYGGEKHAVYAYPRSAAQLSSCLIDGPSRTQSTTSHAAQRRAERHAQSALAVLEAKVLQRRWNEMTAAAATSGSAPHQMLNALQGGSGTTRFVVPTPGESACEVGVLCDDADVALTDCMISNTRLGLLFHDSCEGARCVASDVRCVEEVGIYLYGLAGSAKLAQTTVRACGRECLLVVGPTEAQVAEAEAAFRREHGLPDTPAKQAALGEELDDKDDDEDEEEDEGVPRQPVFAQHPNVRQCAFTGGVRLQGQVRDGACVDNLVFAPAGENTAAAAAAAGKEEERVGADAADASTLILGPNYGVKKAYPMRGFIYAGQEGVPRKPTAADTDAI